MLFIVFFVSEVVVFVFVIAVSIKSTCTKWSIFWHYHSCIHKVSEVVDFFVIVIILLSVFHYATPQIQT